MRVLIYLTFVFLSFFCLSSSRAQAQQIIPQDSQEEWIRLIVPAENTEVISKRPEVRADFLKTIVSDTLLVMLDGYDITQLLAVTEKGFEYSPIMVVQPGQHVLSISVTDSEGRQLQKDFSFSTRHGETFEEAYTSNDLSVNYENVLVKPEESVSLPYAKAEGNLMSNTKLKNKGLEFTLSTNLRYLDQSLPVYPPQKKGVDVANWVFTGSYTKDLLALKISIGDVQVNETMYTVSGLARRGGVFNFQYDNVQLNMFSVKSEQVFGLRGVGIEGTTDDHILGASGGIKFFDRRVEFKTIYVNGGEPGSSFGISTTFGKKKGEAIGVLLLTDMLEGKMRTEFETDFSKYDPDTSDEFDEETDKAYKAKIGGFLGFYTYEAMYEYIGRDYAVIGNMGLQRDKQGASLMNGLNLGGHAINLMLSRYHDNVEDDELFPRIVNYQGNLDYSFSKIPSLPLGINYQKSVQDSTHEPLGTTPIDMHTDTVSGRANYMKDKINVGLQASYSFMNDRTPTDYDTTAATYTLTPSYNATGFSFTPAFSLNQSKNHVTEVRTDTYTLNLDVRTKFLQDKASFDIGGTYNIAKANDDSVDNRNLNINCRLAYEIKGLLKDYLKPTIALRSTYTKYTDEVYSGSDRDEFILYLVLATTMPFSF